MEAKFEVRVAEGAADWARKEHRKADKAREQVHRRIDASQARVARELKRMDRFAAYQRCQKRETLLREAEIKWLRSAVLMHQTAHAAAEAKMALSALHLGQMLRAARRGRVTMR